MNTDPAQYLGEPAGFRTRYRSEPGMIGHYPWTYADQARRRRDNRPEHEYEDLFTRDQCIAAVQRALDVQREQFATMCEQRRDRGLSRDNISYAMASDDCARAIRSAAPQQAAPAGQAAEPAVQVFANYTRPNWPEGIRAPAAEAAEPRIDYFKVQEICDDRRLSYNEVSAAIRDYLRDAPAAEPNSKP